MRRFLKWAAALILVVIVGLVVAYWTPDTDVAAMRAKYGAPPSQFVDVGGGLTVHLRDEGPRDAPVVMLLHGSNADLHTWDPWVERLATRYRIVRFDQIGHGLTGPSPRRDYSDAALVDVVERVSVKLGLTRFVLAGSSMGGGIAWRYALAHPARLSGMVLIDASGMPERTKQDTPLVFSLAQTSLAQAAMLHITPRSLIADGLQQSVSNAAVATPAAIDRYWELLRYPGNRQATLDRFASPPVPTDEAGLRRLTIPTLILWGAEDRLLPVAGAHWFHATIPGSRLIVYPRTGHLAMEEVADASAGDLEGWMASLPQPR